MFTPFFFSEKVRCMPHTHSTHNSSWPKVRPLPTLPHLYLTLRHYCFLTHCIPYITCWVYFICSPSSLHTSACIFAVQAEEVESHRLWDKWGSKWEPCQYIIRHGNSSIVCKSPCNSLERNICALCTNVHDIFNMCNKVITVLSLFLQKKHKHKKAVVSFLAFAHVWSVNYVCQFWWSFAPLLLPAVMLAIGCFSGRAVKPEAVGHQFVYTLFGLFY